MFKLKRRLIERAQLQEFRNLGVKYEFKILDIKGNAYNKQLYEPWKQRAKDVCISHNKILELYHTTYYETDAKSIMSRGFITGYAQNKGIGVYMANHLRYALMWRRPAEIHNLIVGHVIYEPELVHRFRSEIKCPKYSSEYVIKDASLIFPKYLVKFYFKINDVFNRHYNPYVELGKFGCPTCDMPNKYGAYLLCNCKFDGPDKRDFI